MSRKETNRLKYTIALVAEFAKSFGIGERQAYNYMTRFKGIDFLSNYYNTLHTLSFEDGIEAVAAICAQNGGNLSYQHP